MTEHSTAGEVDKTIGDRGAVARGMAGHRDVGNTTRRSAVDIDASIVQYTPVVKRVAYSILMHAPTSIDLQDLVQSGMIGLLEAATRYDEKTGVPFEIFAYGRIRGAIVDDLRALDWTPRRVRKMMRAINVATRKLLNEDLPARASDIAAAVGISLDAYHRLRQEVAQGAVAPIGDDDDFLDMNSDPMEEVISRQFDDGLAQSMASLSEKDREVLTLYYDEDLTFRQIAERIDRTEGAAWQRHRGAVERLRAKLRVYTD